MCTAHCWTHSRNQMLYSHNQMNYMDNAIASMFNLSVRTRLLRYWKYPSKFNLVTSWLCFSPSFIQFCKFGRVYSLGYVHLGQFSDCPAVAAAAPPPRSSSEIWLCILTWWCTVGHDEDQPTGDSGISLGQGSQVLLPLQSHQLLAQSGWYLYEPIVLPAGPLWEIPRQGLCHNSKFTVCGATSSPAPSYTQCIERNSVYSHNHRRLWYNQLASGKVARAGLTQ